MKRKPTPIQQHRLVLFGVIVLTGSIFLTDLSSPLGVAVGVLYTVSILLSSWIPQPSLLLWVAAGASVLTIVGFFHSLPAQIMWLAITNRVLSLLTIWTTAILLFLRQRAEHTFIQSEAHTRAILDTALDAVIGMDEHGIITDWNPHAQVIFGWTAKEAVGQRLSDTVIPPQYREPHIRGLAQFLRTGDGPVLNRRIAITGLRRDGLEFPIELSIVALKTGESYRFNAFVADITERTRAEDEIRRLNSELEDRVRQRTAQLDDANKELDAFSYSVSHDLRAPLRGIDGFSQALLQDYGDKLDRTGHDYLQRIRSATQRMGELIDDLLNFARVGRTEISRREVDLSVLVEGLMQELQQGEPHRHVETVIAKYVTALGDEHLLRIVLKNLLSNAWKFTGKQEQTRIEFGILAQGNGQPVYFVRDNGAGFDMASAGKLFSPFQRLHPVTEFPGNGIGLATVQRILHRHGGRAWAEGAAEQGATIYFSL